MLRPNVAALPVNPFFSAVSMELSGAVWYNHDSYEKQLRRRQFLLRQIPLGHHQVSP